MRTWHRRRAHEVQDRAPPTRRCEKPVLAFADYAVAIHLAAEPAKGEHIAQPRFRRAPSGLLAAWSTLSRSGARDEAMRPPEPPAAQTSSETRALESYERDMLLYAYRHVAPFWSLVGDARGEKRVTVHWPRELPFESEGMPIRLICCAADSSGRTRRVKIVASETHFDRSGVTVLTLVLRPAAGAEPELNEYDLSS